MKYIGLFIVVLVLLVFVMLHFSSVVHPKILLKVDDQAPSFSLISSDQKEVKIEDFKGSPIVIYFFPKAETPGCTAQACALRDAYADFTENKIAIIGISYDSPEKLAAFRKEHHLPFTLLSDQEKKVAQRYGADRSWPFNVMPHRITFLLDKKGVIKEIMPKVSITTHAADILAKAKKLLD